MLGGVPSEELPLFPLASVVLFPGCHAPLHVFEPRYRQMTADALQGSRSIGMVAVRPEHADDLSGAPPLFEVGCAGFVSEHRQLADGRYHLVLRGTRRFRILREIPPRGGRLYRVAEVEALEEPAVSDPALLADLRSAVVSRLDDIARRSGGSDPLPLDQLAALDHAAFAHTLCQALGLPTAEKQGLLEAPDVGERLKNLEGLLAFHLAALSGPSSPSQTLH